MKQHAPLIGTAGLLLILLTLFSLPLGPLPALGPFLQPVHGFLANAENGSQPAVVQRKTSGLEEPVEIFYNQRGVPHIFAGNDKDLYFAQGYVTARDRLFQLELQIRGAGGELSEWMGERTLEYDRYQRRFGMMFGAERALQYAHGSPSEEIFEAYASGINAYIAQLRNEDLPLEFKLLGVEPRRWEPIHTALLLKYMTRTLAGGSSDLTISNTTALFGRDFVDRYINGPSKWAEPIISPDRKWAFSPVPVRTPSRDFTPSITRELEPFPIDPGVGSNNWAVSGSRTASGNAILAGDPHLNLTSPSIWYEMQMTAPGISAYGVTLPGAPGVIMGFSDSLAWCNTNSGADVLDWFEITYRDSSRAEYLHDGQWKPTQLRVEAIRMKGGDVFLDSVRYTHHGPVVYDESFKPSGDVAASLDGMALHWIGHYGSNEMLMYRQLNRATSVRQAREILRQFTAPAQNFALIDASGSIGMVLGGRLPLKWEGQGATIGDGSDSAWEWAGWIPYEHNPYEIDPPRGFVSSANQFPVDGRYPYYLGSSFAPFERGRRVNDLLRGASSVTVEELMRFQQDSYNYLAAVVVPVLVEELGGLLGDDPTSDAASQYVSDPSTPQGFIQTLTDWDLSNDGSQLAPSLFHVFWKELMRGIWQDELNAAGVPVTRPDRDLTAQMLIEEPEARWYDDVETPQRETRTEILSQAVSRAIERLVEEQGTYDASAGNWTWGKVHNVRLPHIARIEGLSVEGILTNGGDESVNAVDGANGPSWRMVVELEGGKPPVAYGVYPGGQSGNPGSPHYDDAVDTWAEGRYHRLELLRQMPFDSVGASGWRRLTLLP